MKIERNMRHDEYQMAEHWCLTKLPQACVLFFSFLLLDVAFFYSGQQRIVYMCELNLEIMSVK